MKLIVLLLFTLFSICSEAQEKTIAINYYNEAVALYNRKEYAKADSLFTVSLKIREDRDAYFSRALCRGKMANKNGYCLDLGEASSLADTNALKLFCKSCGRADTVINEIKEYSSGKKVIVTSIYYYYQDKKFGHYQRYYSQKAIDTANTTNIFVNNGKTLPYDSLLPGRSAAEFPGGNRELMKFLSSKIHYPRTATPGNHKVYVAFVVFPDGTIHDIKLAKAAPDCFDCGEEAQRVIAIMPRWKPGLVEGVPAKCNFTLPVNFKLIN